MLFSLIKKNNYKYFYKKIKYKLSKKFFKQKNNVKTLNVIHIGKCGGSTVRNEILNSKIIKKKYKKILIMHVQKPVYKEYEDYLIILRNPIERALSAFNWRYKLVVKDKIQRYRFKNEYEILIKYNYLNNLAESLYYADGNSNLSSQKDFNLIFHLRESISFYLEELLQEIKPKQLFGVVKQNNLNCDCKLLLGSSNVEVINSNQDNRSSKSLYLSSLASSNLKRFLSKDYQCIVSMYCLGFLSKDQLISLLD